MIRLLIIIKFTKYFYKKISEEKIRDKNIKLENQRLKFFIKFIENKYLSSFSAIQAFKIRYVFKKKHIIEAFNNEFERTINKICGKFLFDFSNNIINTDFKINFSNIDYEILKTPICKLRDQRNYLS